MKGLQHTGVMITELHKMKSGIDSNQIYLVIEFL